MIVAELNAMQQTLAKLTVALAGNANVGKSVIFNHLCNENQIVGNWPGKTVELAKGKLRFKNFEIDVVDLPGIYSFSTYSLEEIVSREFIAFRKPDVIINVVDASVLERNLYFTLQLMEMEVPIVLCLNQIDVAKSKGIQIDTEKLSDELGVPVVQTVAVKGEGLYELMETVLEVAQRKIEQRLKPKIIRFRPEIEQRIEKLTELIESKNLGLEYPSRWIAIKLLENDSEIRDLVAGDIVQLSEILSREIEERHQEPSFAVITAERYLIANRIAGKAQRQSKIKLTLSERIDRVVTHGVFGYLTAIFVLGGLLLWTFFIGNYLSDILSQAFAFFQPVDPQINGPLISIIWNGAFGGIVAGITLIIPFVIPFYFMLTVIEDSGILTRIAFMMDSFMHRIGLHGKALIPLILGYGCNVPAIYTTRILETRRERLLASLAITFAPCSARTIVILGLVAVFVGIEWALLLYVFDIFIIFLIGRIAFKALPGETSGLIMEMHAFRVPTLSVVAKQTWTRTKSIIYIVFPLYIIGSSLMQGLYAFGILGQISNLMSPLTVGWLGLPSVAGVLLIFGIVRKEYILLLLTAIYGMDLSSVLSPAQFLTLALIGMLYFPCISTITILAREFGWKPAIGISITNLAAAILIGGFAIRVLGLMF